jgi:hypothetical protein
MALVKCNHCRKETKNDTGKCRWCNKELDKNPVKIERDYRKEDNSNNKSSVSDTHSWSAKKDINSYSFKSSFFYRVVLDPKSKKDCIISILIFTFFMSLYRLTTPEIRNDLFFRNTIETFGSILGNLFILFQVVLGYIIILSVIASIVLVIRYLINKKSTFLVVFHNWSFYFTGFTIMELIFRLFE